MVQMDPVATIDLSEFDARKPEIVQQLMAAASDIGFFRVKGVRIIQKTVSCPARHEAWVYMAVTPDPVLRLTEHLPFVCRPWNESG